jgi:hypothetical protein
MGTLHVDQYTFLIISGLIIFRMRNISDKSCRENQNIIYVIFFENGAIYEITWKKL